MPLRDVGLIVGVLIRMALEGDILPFRMTAKERQLAVENSRTHSPEHDAVQLFRAKPTPKAPRPPAIKEELVFTRTCRCCKSKVQVKRARLRRPLPPPPQKRWFLYYGPGRMTGGFRTKREARSWFLNGGR